MNKYYGQLRHFLSGGGWLLFLLVFLPKDWWERAIENAKSIGIVLGSLGAAAVTISHVWSALAAKASTNPVPLSDDNNSSKGCTVIENKVLNQKVEINDNENKP